MHIRQNFLALDPRWFSSSDARALSESIINTLEITKTSCCKNESYITHPFSRSSTSSIIGGAISRAVKRLEQFKKIHVMERSSFSYGQSRQCHTPVIKFVPFF